MLSTLIDKKNKYLPIIVILILVHEVSASCHYDSHTGRTICEGLSYGIRLSIAAAISICGAILLTGLSYLFRRIYRSRQTQSVSARYHGQTQPQTAIAPCPSNVTPNVSCDRPVYNPQPLYHAPPLSDPVTQERETYGAPPPGYVYANEPQSRTELISGAPLSQKYTPPADPPLEPHPYATSSHSLAPHPYSAAAQRSLYTHPYAASSRQN
ncbi:uncharacterized protein MELLADRAFT_88352 [Melampsora larici-populina 98AG31]|uniref:Uncharacterized protein n=1 Tax=Melampsora larici-populina (strain 98AG31 / pathotype 3-4-7) TaxID=747676 RepID=F4RRE7_MELLP|nr:uncharacterized protein MELLADRAFT_88352 [Melampsora larici-populina 98AG31]EGG05046.1 hypothetical protein MELLADRAFT_88352 [Melampsora larici-populina 98AG31]